MRPLRYFHDADPRPPTPSARRRSGGRRRHVHALIIGSGFAGLGAAVRLKRDGIEDFLVIERAARSVAPGATTPTRGAACDVPSHLYSFSFELNPNWSRSFSPQPEIQAYLLGIAETYQLAEKHLFDTEVTLASWDDASSRWLVDTSNGAFSADVLVGAVGALAEPKLPDVAASRTSPARSSTPPAGTTTSICRASGSR